MTTFTNTTDQIESIYVGYFGRAGDPSGTNFWVGARNSGTTQSSIAASFAVQPEATSKYPYLANPNIANPTDFINQVYTNLFNRVADAAGLAYWTAQLTAAAGNPTAIGNFILNVISGATGTDDTFIRNKTDVAKDFTTKATNANTAWTSTVQSQSITEIIATTTDASVVTQKAATDTFIAAAPGPALNLTVNTDTLSSGATNASFNGALFFNAPNGTFLQTLTTGDNLTATGTGASLTAVLNTAATAVTTTGISRVELANQVGAGALTGTLTGVTTLSNVNSTTAGLLTVGAAGGGGLKTALTTMNVTGSTTVGATSALIAAAALTGTADALAINVTGAFGTAAAPLQMAFGTDGTAGTVAAVQNSYETVTVNATGATGVNLGGVGGAQSTTTLNLTGAGLTTVFGGAVDNFSKLVTINASTQTGGVTITGLASGATGLVNNTTNVLTSFKGGTGADSLDISSYTTPASLAVFTAGNLDGGTGTARDTLILSAAAAQSTVAINSSNFEILGVVAATGTIDISKWGTGVDQVSLVTTAAAGALTISNAPTAFTFAAGSLINGQALTITGPTTGATDTLTITGNTGAGAAQTWGAQIFNGYETVTETFGIGTATATYTLVGITVNPTAGSVATLNIIDNLGASAFQTDAINVGQGTLNISGTSTGGFTMATAGSTAAVLNASGLNSAGLVTATGLTMNFDQTAATVITGTAGVDILRGSAANDTISAGTGVDNLRGNGGADTLTGGGGNDLFFLASRAETQGVGFAAANTSYANVDKITDFTGNAGAAGDGIVLGIANNAFGAIQFTGTSTAVVTAVTVATAADFTTLAAAVEAASAGVASTAAVAQVYDVTVTAGAMAGRVMIVNDATAAIAATDTFVSITGITGALNAQDFTFAA